jgi:neutral ceramidase
VFEERFDTPVMVALLQGGAGDASPAGSDQGYANMETVGEYAADALYGLWESIPLGSAPIRLETASRSVPQMPADIRVTRGGTVDLRYSPYDEDLEPDNVVYGDDGSILSPIDEFNVPYGAAFCGENPAYLPGYAPADVFPYNQCVTVDKMEGIIASFFDLEEDERSLPLLESKVAAVTATRFGPVRIREADGTETEDDFFVGFFPGEATAMFTEQFRRRADSELGYRHSMAVGYSQDHEGYLLIPEDWLTGGYEIDINVWGPLQGEHIMEQLLVMADEHLSTDVVEAQDPCGDWQPTDYGAWEMPPFVADLSPEAGTALASPPDYLYSPLYSDEEFDAGVVPGVSPPAVMPRVQGLAEFAWIGGDPAVDFPIVTLERQQDDGSFATVTTGSGRPVRLGPDILLAHTPSPLNPPEAEQTHYWYAAWQAVGHVADRTGLPLGTYRLHVEGSTWSGATGVYPDSMQTIPYTVDSPAFAVVPAAISLTKDGDDLLAWIEAPARGYRLVDLDGSSRGENPLPDGPVTCTATQLDGTSDTVEATAVREGDRTRLVDMGADAGAVRVSCVDTYGNEGVWEALNLAAR